ncbi:FAD-binding oxidoreductase [uncultured Alsobacter sp.]|uniref:FAD-binding oxidoreductase n=1 Tax=uncultured Alsobacter sp. TaxID=1748258 RepID=UPI00345C8905
MSAPSRTAWQGATLRDIAVETPRIRRLVLEPDLWRPSRAGQHVDLRLTAPDGYTAVRSYSLCSPPERPATYEIAVELLPEGEVSSYLHEGAAVGDRIEIRGPVGGHFVWSAADGGPLLLVGGGSGLVPLVAMLRHRAAAGARVPVAVCVGARHLVDVPFLAELTAMAERHDGVFLSVAVSREAVSHPYGQAGRLDAALLSVALGRLSMPPRTVFVCGSNRFVEGVTQPLLELGVSASVIRTERFGGA